MDRERSLSLHTVMFLWVTPFLLGAAGLCAFFTYARAYKVILDGFDRKLSAAAATSAAFINGDDHNKLMQGEASPDGRPAEESALYQLYSQPMKRIMNDAQLTYHYTIVLKDQSKIVYGIDATEGEEHSYLGTEEENPAEEASRLWHALKTGIVSISPIQQFDIWGKLKIANAPIRDSSGATVGLVGADVNISVIDKKTRLAFLQVLGAGILTLLLAAIMTWFLAGLIAEPLRRLKECALRLGGGDFDAESEKISQPELRELGSALDALGENLKSAPLCLLRDQNGERRARIVTLVNAIDGAGTAEDMIEQASSALQERLSILQQFMPFRALTTHELLVVAQSTFLVKYRAGAIICPRGLIPPTALLVVEGNVLGDLSSPVAGMVGVELILFDRPLTEDLRAHPRLGARCLALNKEHLFTMLHECPGFMKGLIESALGRVA